MTTTRAAQRAGSRFSLRNNEEVRSLVCTSIINERRIKTRLISARYWLALVAVLGAALTVIGCGGGHPH